MDNHVAESSDHVAESSADHGAGNPGWRDRAKIISEKETAKLLDLSHDTLRRMHARGEGPKRLKLSPGRVGYRLGDVLDYVASVAAGA